MVKLSIIIPTYNEEQNIGALLRKCNKVLTDHNITHELIVVDDMSKDKTGEEVRKQQDKIPQVKLIERNERGIATALVNGYNSARGELLGSIDADLAHDPVSLPYMVKLVEAGRADFVIGSRYAPGSRVQGKPLINMIASRVGQIFIRFYCKMPQRDTSNNFRVFRRKIWDNIKHLVRPSGNVMIFEMVYLAHKGGYKIIEIPTTYTERRFGRSKIRVTKETIEFFKSITKMVR